MSRPTGTVAGLLPMRASSVRCVNKMLRPFGDTNLARLALERISRSSEVDTIYLAAHEEPLLELAKDFPRVKVIRRSRASAFGEDAAAIYDFLGEIKESTIATLNACAPFVQIETYDRAIREFCDRGCRSLLPVVETQEWYFDESGRILNVPDATIINSKSLPKVFRATHPFTIYEKERFAREYIVWTFQPDDPHLFRVAEDEGIDIDTEAQFEMAEALYLLRRARTSQAAQALG